VIVVLCVFMLITEIALRTRGWVRRSPLLRTRGRWAPFAVFHFHCLARLRPQRCFHEGGVAKADVIGAAS
jgi:hypothetical protein